MDKKFDYSEFELGKLTYQFAELTPEQADEKRSLYEQFVREKEEQRAAQIAAKTAAQSESTAPQSANPVPKPRPAFRPSAKPATQPLPAESANSEGSSIEHPLTDATPDEMQHIAQGGLESKKHPVFRPTQKPVAPAPAVPAEIPDAESEGKTETAISDSEQVISEAPKPKPVFRPTMKPPTNESEVPSQVQPVNDPKPEPAARPAFRPTMKPPKPTTNELEVTGETPPINEPKPEPAARPAFRPTMKPKAVPPIEDKEKVEPTVPTDVIDEKPEVTDVEPVKPKPKPVFRPTMKPKADPPKAETDDTAPSE